jgi:hypothetical protein
MFTIFTLSKGNINSLEIFVQTLVWESTKINLDNFDNHPLAPSFKRRGIKGVVKVV